MWLSSFLLWNALVFGQQIVPATAEDNEFKVELQKKIFKDAFGQRTCKQIDMDINGGIKKDSEFQKKIADSVALLQSLGESFSPGFFHPRLRVTKSQIQNEIKALEMLVGKKFSVTPLYLFALQSPGGATTPQIVCSPARDQNYLFHNLYGYQWAISLWLQVTGENELAHVHMLFVGGREKKWLVGLLEKFQWTHGEMTAVDWLKQSQAVQKGLFLKKFIFQETAKKLLRPTAFVEFGAYQEIPEQSRDEVQKYLETSVLPEKLVFFDTMFLEHKVGLVLRMKTEKEISLVDIRSRCDAIYSKIKSEISHDKIGGIRCAFNFPKEDPIRDGILGGIVKTTSAGAK